MGKRARSGGRLRIHSETVRNLTNEEMRRAVGGVEGPVFDGNPRTNAWTAGVYIGVAPMALCGGSR